MPTYLRRFYLKKLVEAKKQEKQQIEKASKNSQTTNNPTQQGSYPSRFRK
jgi:hypothetical protein